MEGYISRKVIKTNYKNWSVWNIGTYPVSHTDTNSGYVTDRISWRFFKIFKNMWPICKNLPHRNSACKTQQHTHCNKCLVADWHGAYFCRASSLFTCVRMFTVNICRIDPSDNTVATYPNRRQQKSKLLHERLSYIKIYLLLPQSWEFQSSYEESLLYL